MKSNLQLASTDGRSAERDDLQQAIERHDASTRRLAQLGDALERVAGQSHEAIGELEVLEARLRDTKRRESNVLAQLALGEINANPMQADQNAVTQAEVRCDTLRKTRLALTADRQREEKELSYAQAGVDRTVRAVLRVEGADFIDTTMREARELQEQLAGKRAMLKFFESCFEFPGDMELSAPLRKFLSAPLPDASNSPQLVRWRQAQEALRQDADVELPTA